MEPNQIDNRTAVIIPCYKVREHVLKVIDKIASDVWRIYVVDDACPEGSGQYVKENCEDERVRIIFLDENQGVGGAVMAGYQAAIDDGADILVKIDGDGQMDPRLVSVFVAPILQGKADYTKGNRFFDLENIKSMPRVRIFGNAALSFMAKMSTGYWDLFDPTNGYTAIHVAVAKRLPFEKISKRYFFETDILFRLNTLQAVVTDVPMHARYDEEISNLEIKKIIGEFLLKHMRNILKRIFYNYYLRDVSIASIELPLGVILLIGGVLYGGYHWFEAARDGITTPAGTVMLAALPILMGVQFIMGFIGYDIARVPRSVKHDSFSQMECLERENSR
ncbi:glycosyltransferase family 2 protein [Mariprofundus ferrooxydans]|uniref:glycosyltransferase family 2 protein n=1 Tax=Mariprofundus ferrooxydans TaxID=314344 RepID=UPI001F0E24EB|nr:glycosyltransferase family 2 protein [Mariprofundus ferrooxydans]